MTAMLPVSEPDYYDWLTLRPYIHIKSRRSRFVVMLLSGVGFLLLGHLAFTLLKIDAPVAAALFPAVGFSVAMVLIFGADALLGTMVGASSFSMLLQPDWAIALWSALRAGLEAGLIAYLVKLLQIDIQLRRLRDVLRLVVLASPLPVMLNATFACINELFQKYTPLNQIFNSWWTLVVADMVSILTVVPFMTILVINLITAPWQAHWQRFHQFWWTKKHWLEGILWLGFTALVMVASMFFPIREFLFNPLPFLSVSWAAARFGMITTMVALSAINCIEVYWVLHKYGAFAEQISENIDLAVLELQTFIAVIVVMGLSLAALTEERQQLLKDLLQQRKFDRLMIDISQRVADSLNVQEILDVTVQRIYDMLGLDRVYFSQIMSDGSSLITAEACNPKFQSVLGYVSPAKSVREMAQWYQTSGVAVTPDVSQAQQMHPTVKQLCEHYEVKARLAMPLFVDGKGYALLTLHQCRSTRQWTGQEIAFLEQVVLFLGTALHQSLLFQREQNLVTELDQKVQARTQELQRSLLAQETLNEGQARLLHAVSHDLRTPIVGSLLVLQQMLKRDSGDNLKVLTRLRESGERQLVLIQSLLEDYRAEDATLRFHFQRIKYDRFIATVLRTLSPILQSHTATVDVNIAPDLPAVEADPVHLQRVLENLITNALKHNEPGLAIQLNASMITDATIDYLRCEVVDNGVGIPPQIAKQLFSRPYLRSTDGSDRTGMGLGLYLCYQIVTAHGGRMTVEPHTTGGKFVFTLPVAITPIDTRMEADDTPPTTLESSS